MWCHFVIFCTFCEVLHRARGNTVNCDGLPPHIEHKKTLWLYIEYLLICILNDLFMLPVNFSTVKRLDFNRF